MRPFLRDLAWSSRALRATPAAAVAAILTIALGTGANTAVFAVAYGVLFRPLACPEPSRIVVVSFHAPKRSGDRGLVDRDRGLAAPCPRFRRDGALQRHGADHSRHRRATSREDRPGDAVVLRRPRRARAGRPAAVGLRSRRVGGARQPVVRRGCALGTRRSRAARQPGHGGRPQVPGVGGHAAGVRVPGR